MPTGRKTSPTTGNSIKFFVPTPFHRRSETAVAKGAKIQFNEMRWNDLDESCEIVYNFFYVFRSMTEFCSTIGNGLFYFIFFAINLLVIMTHLNKAEKR